MSAGDYKPGEQEIVRGNKGSKGGFRGKIGIQPLGRRAVNAFIICTLKGEFLEWCGNMAARRGCLRSNIKKTFVSRNKYGQLCSKNKISQ